MKSSPPTTKRNWKFVAALIAAQVSLAGGVMLVMAAAARPHVDHAETTVATEEPQAELGASPTHTPPRAARLQAPEAHPLAPPAGEDLRGPVQAAVDATLSTVHDAADLSRLLANLEEAARVHRHVTAFDVEPGLAAIRSVYGADALEARAQTTAFAGRMQKLSFLLDPPSPAPADPRAPDHHNQGDPQ
jgi:hypothetical protein